MNRIIKNRKFRLLLACISLLLLVDMIQDSYAKYVSSAEAESNLTIASWAFLVNQQDVISNSNFSNTIVPVLNQNNNIKTGTIAPTSTGYIDVTIDSSDVEVAFSEQISLSTGNNNTVDDLIFTGYKLNNGQTIAFQNNTNPSITVNHNLNEIETVNTYRFYIEWDDGLNSTMDNADDVAASTSGIASIAVNINFTQIASQSNQGSGSDPGSNSDPGSGSEPDPEPDPGSGSDPNSES